MRVGVAGLAALKTEKMGKKFKDLRCAFCGGALHLVCARGLVDGELQTKGWKDYYNTPGIFDSYSILYRHWQYRNKATSYHTPFLPLLSRLRSCFRHRSNNEDTTIPPSGNTIASPTSIRPVSVLRANVQPRRSTATTTKRRQ